MIADASKLQVADAKRMANRERIRRAGLVAIRRTK